MLILSTVCCKKSVILKIHVYYFHFQVESRYLTSAFMGHATAEDLQDAFHETCSDIGFSNLLQLSMDGPNVNWKFHRIITEEVERENHKTLLNIGSCGLHVIHNAFRNGHDASKWEVDSFLSTIYYLMDETPTRREDYTKVTGN